MAANVNLYNLSFLLIKQKLYNLWNSNEWIVEINKFSSSALNWYSIKHWFKNQHETYTDIMMQILWYYESVVLVLISLFVVLLPICLFVCGLRLNIVILFIKFTKVHWRIKFYNDWKLFKKKLNVYE